MRPAGYGECLHCRNRAASGSCREARWCQWSSLTKVGKGGNGWEARTVTVSASLPPIEDDRFDFYDLYRSELADE